MQGLSDIADLLGMTRRCGDGGFSVVELLVVMLIVGVLAGISVPTFLGQREKAAQAAMKSDLHTLRLAQESRSVDNDRRYTSSLAILRDEGYVQSSGVSEPHIRLSNSDNEYVACVKHDVVAEWLVYSSVDNRLEFDAADCAPA